ncbi:MAG: hypothetical protein AAF799_41600 [Myxococcota bacterium]
MRITATSLGLLGTLLAGCMAPMEAEDLVLEDAEAVTFDELRSVPDAQRLAPTPPPPTVEVEVEPPVPAARSGSAVRPRFIEDTSEQSCASVWAAGFPAISADGQTVVVPRADHLELSMISGALELQWHDVGSGAITEVDPVVDGMNNENGSCSTMERGDHRQIQRVNRALAKHRWRTMEPLPVAFFNPDTGHQEYRDEYFGDVPGSARVPQLGIRHGEIFLRIPGVRVLERHAASAELNWHPFAVFGDRSTGTAVIVSMDCAGESCTCDPSYTAQVVQWQPETFDVIEQRPCLDPDTHDEVADGWAICEPIDFGIGTVGSAWAIG